MRVGFEAWGLNFQVNRPLINWEKIGLCHVCHCFFIAAFSITIVVCFFVFKGASNDDSIFICIKQHCCCKCTVSVETKNASKVENNLRRYPGFDPITFTFSENSNYGRESLLEV